MRKLAHIERIDALEPIEGADRIEKAEILGWNCVVKKGEFKVGDLCIYIEVDSILPDHPEFEFMRDRKFRVKTIKLRKQISQGLALPYSIINLFQKPPMKKYTIEDDVTDIIGIKKHDPQAAKEDHYKPLHPKKKMNPVISYMSQFHWFRKVRYNLGFEKIKNFPHFIAKTDEERLQNIPHILNQWKDEFVYFTEKCDGSSATYAYYKDPDLNFIGRWLNKHNFYVCSRNILLLRENKTEWWEIARKFDIKEKLKSIGENIGIQGEIIGPGIQGNKYKLKELDFYVYNVVNLNTRKKYNIEEKLLFCEQHSLKHVPLLFSKETPLSVYKTVDSLINLSKGKSTLAKIKREGIVVRCINDDHKSFKCINPEFLLKFGE